MADRTLTGYIAADGRVVSGTGGYRVVHDEAGLYTVLFDQAFTRPPAVVTTQVFPGDVNSTGGDPRDNSVVVGINLDRFRMETGEDNGKKADRQWTFIAFGS